MRERTLCIRYGDCLRKSQLVLRTQSDLTLISQSFLRKTFAASHEAASRQIFPLMPGPT